MNMKTRSFAVCAHEGCEEGPNGVILDPKKGIIIRGDACQADPENRRSLLLPEDTVTTDTTFAYCQRHFLETVGWPGLSLSQQDKPLVSTNSLKVELETAKQRIAELETLLDQTEAAAMTHANEAKELSEKLAKAEAKLAKAEAKSRATKKKDPEPEVETKPTPPTPVIPASELPDFSAPEGTTADQGDDDPFGF